MSRSIEEAYEEWLSLYNLWLEKQEEYESLRSAVDKALASKAAVIGIYPPVEVLDELEKLLGDLNDLERKRDALCRNLDSN
jgi:hypothetical protein